MVLKYDQLMIVTGHGKRGGIVAAMAQRVVTVGEETSQPHPLVKLYEIDPNHPLDTLIMEAFNGGGVIPPGAQSALDLHISVQELDADPACIVDESASDDVRKKQRALRRERWRMLRRERHWRWLAYCVPSAWNERLTMILRDKPTYVSRPRGNVLLVERD